MREIDHPINRDPDIAIFVEMFDNIKKSIWKFFISYIWLFVGWVVAFHITLQDETNSFKDIGSSIVKVLTMFTGDMGFDTTFANATKFKGIGENWDQMYNNGLIFILYSFFLVEMCIILMNLTIGISISNIQVNLNLVN